MLRPAGGALPHPYLDPGGPYSTNLWDWDSYWAAVSLFFLAEEYHDEDMLAQVREHARGSLLNFFAVQGLDGSLPILICPDDKDVFDAIDHPQNNMAKPVQALFLKLLWEKEAIDADTACDILRRIKLVHECRKQRYLHAESGLFVWANDIAIGIDDDPAVWGRDDFSCAHIYYNSLLAMDLEAAYILSGQLQQHDWQKYFGKEHTSIAQAICHYCWDKRDGWFYSCDVRCQQNLRPNRLFGQLNINLTPFWTIMPLRIRSFSGLLPLVAKLASPEQAAAVVEKLTDRREFWSDYGIRTMSKIEDRFYEDTQFRGNPSNWLGPVWIISSYLAYVAMKNYGYDEQAAQLAANTWKLLDEDFRKIHVLHEYYSPEDGRPLSGAGFLNWNLLVFCMK